jgi:CDP-4-dehydro-6-deoxyglucose reductase
MVAITTTHGQRFESQGSETLLDAALRHGITLEYSCRTGRCGSCKGRVHSGATTAVRDELGLSLEERAQGWILTCSRHASSDVHLDVADLGDAPIPPARTLPCRIQALERLSADVMKVVLRLPPTTPLDFLPGQYIECIGPAGIRRSYSIANAPSNDKLIELHVREVPNGAMSTYWFEQAKVNDLLRLKGPLGTFFLRRLEGQDLVFLATGTGIAPVKAMLEGLRTLQSASRPRSVSVYWGGRLSSDLYWDPAAVDLPTLRFIPVLSRANAGWQGATGYVQQVLLNASPDLPQTVVYACGSDSMIRSAQARLVTAGLPATHFRSDAFVCSAST